MSKQTIASYLIAGFYICLLTTFSFLSKYNVPPLDSETNQFYILLYLLSVPIVLLFAVRLYRILKIIQTKFKRNKFNNEEWKKSLAEAGLNDAVPFRELTLDEQKYFENFLEKRQKEAIFSWLLIIIVPIVTFSYPTYLIVFYKVNPKDLFVLLAFFLVLFLVGVAPTAFYLFLGKAREKRSNYLDRISPIFKVEGEVFKETQKIEDSNLKNNFLTVKGLKFKESNYGQFEGVPNGESVVIEFSPFTKRVWKIYKTEEV